MRRHEGLARLGEVKDAPPVALLDANQSFIRKLLQHRVDRSCARSPGAATALGDLLNELVAVEWLLREQSERGGADIATAYPAPAPKAGTAEATEWPASTTEGATKWPMPAARPTGTEAGATIRPTATRTPAGATKLHCEPRGVRHLRHMPAVLVSSSSSLLVFAVVSEVLRVVFVCCMHRCSFSYHREPLSMH